MPRTIGRGRLTSKGMGGREGKRRADRIEEGKGRKGGGRNVAFHHLYILLSNLTTVGKGGEGGMGKEGKGRGDGRGKGRTSVPSNKNL